MEMEGIRIDDLVWSAVGLAVKPLFLAKQCCIFVVGSVCIVVQTFLELLRHAFSLHFAIFWRIMIWSVGLLSLPVRAFKALYRERLLEMQVQRLKKEIESLVWSRKALEDQLIKQGKMMEMMQIEFEEEHDEAIVKIEQLQAEVQDLKAKTQQSKEIQGKTSRERDNDNNLGIRTQVNKDDGGCNFSEVNQREKALFGSLSSAILWLVVGVVMLEAKDPCTPLLLALFTVVTMSLFSIVRLFTKVEHKLALTLLCTNWFILGALAYPMLPNIASFSAHLALSFMRFLTQLAYTFASHLFDL